MPRLLVRATELQEPELNFVAMVKRGATRLPYKITKGEDEVSIDLYKIGRGSFGKSETPVEPQILGAILSKSADVAKFVEIAKANGLAFDTTGFVKAEKDDLVTFTKADAKAEDGETLVMKISDDVALVVKADKEFVKSMSSYDWESTSFSEVLSKGSFCPSVSMAQDMLQRTFYNIMEKAENAKDLAKLMQTATGEFETYVTALAKGLPASVFKAEKELGAVFQKQHGTDKTAENIVGNKEKTRVGADLGDKDELAGDKAKPAEAKPAVTEQPTEIKEKTTATDEPQKKETQKTEAPDIAAIVKNSIEAGLKPLTTRLEAIETRVQKTEKSLTGTVQGTDRGTDRGVKKSEVSDDDWTSGAPPILDTAYGRNDSTSKH